MSEWMVRWWTYPGGGEVQAVKVWATSAAGGDGGVILLNNENPEDDGATGPTERLVVVDEDARQRNRERAAARARGQVRRSSLSHSMRYMLTLTFPGAEGVQDYGYSLELVSGFLRLHGKELLMRWVGVPELHKRHGWHWHLLTDRRINVLRTRILWTRWLSGRGIYPSGGAVWARIDAKDWGSGQRAARYAVKYVTKKCDVPAGRHRYVMSDSAQPNVPVVGIIGAETGGEVLKQLLDWGMPGRGIFLLIKDESDQDWTGPPLVLARWE